MSVYVMYNSVNDSLKGINIDDHIIIILDPSQSNFREYTKKAIHKGFRHPLITNTFFKQHLTHPHVFLYQKYNHHYGKAIEEDEYQNIKKKLDFSLRNFKTTKSDPCRIYIQLEDDTLEYLHNYSKLYKFNIDGKSEQREISGNFLLYETVPNTFLVKIDEKNANLGDKENATSVNTLSSFHTHPIEAYRKYNVCMAWPSIDDYITILSIYSEGYGMFHILGTVEGIYIVTISDRMMKEGRKKIRENIEYYKSEIDKKYHKNYPVCDIDDNLRKDKKVWTKKIKAYLKWINSLKYFYVQFRFWKDAKNPIPIHYRGKNGNCVLNDEQVKFSNLLETKQKIKNL